MFGKIQVQFKQQQQMQNFYTKAAEIPDSKLSIFVSRKVAVSVR
jgi:hypothetical protein